MSVGGGLLDYDWCTEEELGLIQGPNTRAYPILESSLNELKTYRKKFKCIKENDMVIWGNYSSQKAQQIAFRFKMCTGHSYCKNEREVRDWLKRKFIVILHNQIRFDTQVYGKGAVVKESRLIYHGVSSQISVIVPFKVQKTEIELHDFDVIKLDKFTMYESEGLFGLEQVADRSYEESAN